MGMLLDVEGERRRAVIQTRSGGSTGHLDLPAGTKQCWARCDGEPGVLFVNSDRGKGHPLRSPRSLTIALPPGAQCALYADIEPDTTSTILGLHGRASVPSVGRYGEWDPNPQSRRAVEGD